MGLRVLYSFPHKLGADRICHTAWHQVAGLAAAGAEVTVFPGVLQRATPPGVRVCPTLARGPFRIPYRALGRLRACAFHDYVVSRRVEKMAGEFDIVHAWALGARRTLLTAARMGIPAVLERPNAHTRFAYEVVRRECDRIGVPLPATHEHAFNSEILRREDEEYGLADGLLCPSDFVVKTFVDEGFPREKLVRHIYGYDERRFFSATRTARPGLTMLSVGVCAVRKGLHFALEAWLRSPASDTGTFLIAGEFLPAYAAKLAPMLNHPSVKVLGHRTDVDELMRQADILALPSIEEGFGLVVAEAMGSGCVPLTSDACTDICQHLQSGLVHPAGDVEILGSQITLLHENRPLLEKLRAGCLAAAPEVTWTAAGRRLIAAYHEVLANYRN